MTDVRQDQQPGARDRCGYVLGVCAFDRLVVVAIHHQHRCLDRLELRVGPVRLGVPHLADLRDEFVVLRRRGGQPGVFVAGALDVAGEGWVLLHAFLHARCHGVGGEGEDLADAVRMADRQVQSEDRSVAPAHDVGATDMQRVQQAGHVVGHQVVAVGTRVARAAAVAAAVHQDDGMARHQRPDLVPPIVRVGQAAMQQHHRRSPADRGIVQADAVDLGVSGMLRRHRGRRGRQCLPQRIGPRRAQREQQQRQEQYAADRGLHAGKFRAVSC